MEEYKENPTHFYSIKQLSPSDPSKKRKLEEQLVLPLSKHKFRNRPYNLVEEYPSSDIDGHGSTKQVDVTTMLHSKEHLSNQESPTRAPTEMKQQDFARDGYSIADESETISINPEILNRTDFSRSLIYDQPSSSCGSCSASDSFKNSIYSLESRAIEKRTKGESSSNYTKYLQLELEYLDPDEQMVESSPYDASYEYSDNDRTAKENYLDMEAEESSVLSDNDSSHLYLLSSGRWSINQGELLKLEVLSWRKYQ
ncbi:uncharacterized protein LOC18436187 [Amborella trichopoda]|nr:uncharacterized protein LOC18436187 [Amborella trichopoda]|eukprot:XP_006846272.2 uncharacterized protein LOC18436187 [Amborella trichopoda]